jgi:hypothetical protein
MGRPIVAPASVTPENKKVELPYHALEAPANDVQRAIVHVQAMRMVIPSIQGVFVNPSTRVRGRFVSLSVDDFMDVLETAEPYLVEASVNTNVPRMMIHLRDEWRGEYEIHMFPRNDPHV